MHTPSRELLRFDRFTLDRTWGCLRQGVAEIALRPKTYDVLCYLANHAGRLVAKDEIVAAVWPTVCVTDDSLVQCVRELRQALHDSGQNIIRTVPRRGYRFVAAVAGRPDRSPAADSGRAAGERSPPFARAASLAVLPFLAPRRAHREQLLADGVGEEAAAALSRAAAFTVVPVAPVAASGDPAADLRRLHRGFGVRYVLRGRVRRAGSLVRVGVQLLEAETAGLLWADRFEERDRGDLEIEDRVGVRISGAVQPVVRTAEARRAAREPADALDAYGCVMRALPSVWLVDAQANAQALDLLHRAIALDPTYGHAMALAAWSHGQRAIYHWSSSPAEERAEALRLAAAARRSCDDEPGVLTALGAAHNIARDFPAADGLLRRSVAVDPSSAWAWNRSGWLHLFMAQPEIALAHFRRAIRVSPLDPINSNTRIGIGCAHFKAGRYADCVTWVVRGISERPSAVWAYRCVAAASAHLGRLDGAREALRPLLRAHPGVTVSSVVEALPNDPEYVARFAAGLEMGGLPA